ncbi:MAG: aspartate/glutamate racemase family protein [Rhodobacteraceae bacterium]|nr:aspartate/glutamate racemase family protein [Paracoccaceae bacterium]
MHIGMIGGIGPAATVAYYQRLVAAFRDLGKPLDLTIVNAHVNTLVANAEAGRKQQQAEVYAGLLARLKATGADFGTITSLGGHFCFTETEAISPLPLVSAIAPMDACFAAAGIRTIGLLGARQVTGSQLFGQLTQTQILAPDNLDAVHSNYLETALTAKCTEDQRMLFFREGQKMIDRGADAILLGGSDLGLAFDGHDPGFPVVDGVDVHVQHLVKLATETA